MNKILKRKKEIDYRCMLLFLVFIIFDMSIMVVNSFPQTASEDTKNKDKKSLPASFQIKNYSENIAWTKSIFRSGASFSSDGKLIAIPAGFGSIQLINASDYSVIKIIYTNDNADMEKAFFPSDGHFVSGIAQNAYVYTWDISDGHQVSKVRIPEDCTRDLSQVAISPNNMLAAFPCQEGTFIKEGTIHLWNMKDGKFIGKLKPNRTFIKSIIFSKDGKILASSNEMLNLDIWDVAHQKLLRSIATHGNDIAAIALSPGGRFAATASPDINVWRISDGSLIKKLSIPGSDGIAGRSTVALAFSPNERLIVSGELTFLENDGISDGSNLNIWDTEKGQYIKSVSWPDNSIEGIEFSPSGNIIMTKASNDIRLLRIHQGTMLKQFRGYGSDAESIAYSSDSKYLLNLGGSKVISFWRSADGALEKEISVWRSADGTLENEISYISSEIGNFQLSPDGKYLCTREYEGEGEGAYYLWRVDDATKINEEVANADEDCDIHGTVFSKDSSMLATIGDCYSEIISLETGKINVILEHKHRVSSFAFSPACCISAWGNPDGIIYMYDIKSGKLIRHWKAHDNEIVWLNFFQDGKILVTMDNDKGTLKSWKIPEAIKIDEYDQTSKMKAWAISRNGQMIAICGEDSLISFFTLNPIKRIAQWKAPGKIEAMKLSSDGSLIAIVADKSPVILLYRTADGSLVEELKGHRSNINAFEFSPDNKYLAAASSDGIIVWDLKK